jgi:hypothetical protein
MNTEDETKRDIKIFIVISIVESDTKPVRPVMMLL